MRKGSFNEFKEYSGPKEAISLSLSLSVSLCLSPSLSLTISHILSVFFYLFHFLSLCLSGYVDLYVSLSLYFYVRPSLSLSITTLSLSLSLYLSLPFCPFLSLFPTFSVSVSLTRSPPPAVPPLSPCACVSLVFVCVVACQICIFNVLSNVTGYFRQGRKMAPLSSEVHTNTTRWLSCRRASTRHGKQV